jgi:methylthioribulose-1-phosphate dehydratase
MTALHDAPFRAMDALRQLRSSSVMADHVPHEVAQSIVAAGQRLDRFGWVPATAGNISRRLASGDIAITRSGVHKGFLSTRDIIIVAPDGTARDPAVRPSAETLLHCQLYARYPTAQAVVHGHSVPSTVLSLDTAEAITLAGYEVQKIFEGQTTHEATVRIPVVDNDQDIVRLARVVTPLLCDGLAGYVIRGHGTYLWGPDMGVALARFEGLEFLLACELERRRGTR